MKNSAGIRSIKVDAVNPDQPLGRFLLILLRAFEAELITEARKAGFRDVTLPDLQILHFVKPEGSLATEISVLAGITKQGAGKAVTSLEERGYLIRKPSREDGRAKIVAFTDRGMKLLDHAITVIQRIERRYRQKLGVRDYALVRKSLATLIDLHAEDRIK